MWTKINDDSIHVVLLKSKIRTKEILQTYSKDDKRNTLIAELVARTKSSVAYYQAMNDSDLADAGNLFKYLRNKKYTYDQLKNMTVDDMNNTVIAHQNSKKAANKKP